jgi:DtxR family Mn-dependent transcriptional regulator
MVDPVMALVAAVVLGGAAALLLWPVRGLYWRWEHVLRASDRVLSEDALKYLFDCEYRELTGTLHGLTGALGISDKRAVRLLQRLQQLGLIDSEAGEYRLTEEGRAQALQIIRVHRLWEHHLAEDTGMDAAAWHREADRREHTTSVEEAEAMAARHGHPRYDPHGDPIPTASGELRPHRGRPLSDLKAGDLGRIAHLEDEPESVYRQLVDDGLSVGMQVQVLASGREAVRFEADGREHSLAPVVADNVSVAALAEGQAIKAAADRMSALSPGQQGTVVGISSACRGAERRRLMDLGLIPGTVVAAELQGPGGDPTGYRIRGAVIALRRQQADWIQIRRPGEGGAEGKAKAQKGAAA